ncbi:MAG: hypothetical protein JWN70_1639 [Planctomycetaceae bacterium]|nr:hypothetical protein [Planctomycetaceae bacterium]
MPCVEITISPTGQTHVQTNGFSGASCRVGSEFIERALGTTVHEQRTPEFYQVPVQSEATQTEPC